jgi:drug/metabolite transporter (DMT)-like permease
MRAVEAGARTDPLEAAQRLNSINASGDRRERLRLQPAWATLLGWAILGEQVRTVALLGTGIVVVGIVVTTRRPPS